MIPEIIIQADPKALNTIMQNIERAPVRFNALVNNVVLGRGGLQQRAAKELTPYPGKPKPGITRLMTRRQRAAFWATRGFGGGIPYRRTHKLRQSWRFVFKPLTAQGGGSLTISNIDPKARFVIGKDQQRFHADTGWIRVDTSPALNKFQRDLTRDLVAIGVSVITGRKGR